ncbi:MAG: hypothetical protein ACOYIF_04085 [Acetivibrionales bacterium]
MDCRLNTAYEGAKRPRSRAIDVILNAAQHHTSHPERNEAPYLSS